MYKFRQGMYVSRYGKNDVDDAAKLGVCVDQRRKILDL